MFIVSFSTDIGGWSGIREIGLALVFVDIGLNCS